MKTEFTVIGEIQVQVQPNGAFTMVPGVERVELNRQDSSRSIPPAITNSGERIRPRIAHIPTPSTRLSFYPWSNQFDPNKVYLVAFKTEGGNVEGIGRFDSKGIFSTENLTIGLNPSTQERFNPN